MQMTVATATPERHIELTQQSIPSITLGGARIRVNACGLCGSDVDKLCKRPLNAPVVLGHEVVGVIESFDDEVDSNLNGLNKGQRVAVAHHVPCFTCHYCRNQSYSMCRTFKQTNIHPGGFAEFIDVSSTHLAHSVLPIADTLSDITATSMEPLACCIRAVERSMVVMSLTPETSVAIIGMGYIGAMTAQCYRQHDIRVFGLDRDPNRVALVQEHGWADVVSADAAQLGQAVTQQTPTGGVDGVFLSVVTPQTLALALDLVRDGGWILLFSQSMDTHVPVEIPADALYFREITVLTSYSPAPEHLKKALAWLTDRRVVVDPLVTHTVPLADLQQGVDLYTSGQAIKVVVTV